MDYRVVLTNLFILFSLMAVGYFAGRRGLVSDKAEKDLTAIVMKITLPSTIFISMQRSFDQTLFKSGLQIIFFGLLLILLTLALAPLLARLLRVPLRERGVWSFAATFANNGFMGFPIVLAVYGGEGMFLAALLNLSYSLCAFTLGAKLISRDAAHAERIRWRGILLSNINIAIALGLVCFLTQARLPAPLLTAVDYFAATTTPLSMLLTGLSLSHGRVKALFSDKHAFSAALARLVVFPTLYLALAHLLPFAPGALAPRVAVLSFAMPTAVNCLMLAAQYDCDVTFAGRTVFASSLLSIITIPILLLLL